jgi:hypothetical protein
MSIAANDTIVIMVSIGDRSKLTDYTYISLQKWATKNGYSSLLLKKEVNPKNRLPHFNKLLAHTVVPGFKRYIIVDDDLYLKADAPPVEDVPNGYVGLCRDAEQRHTEAAHVTWTANTGFIVADSEALWLLEKAYTIGDHTYTKGDGSGKAVWPFLTDQSILNYVVFQENKVFELNWKWNHQPVLEYFIHGKDHEEWKRSKFYRLQYYLSLYSPFPNKHKQKVTDAYGIHMIAGVYPKVYEKFVYK